MSKRDTQIRIAKLKKAINYYRYLYHAQNRSEISDEALDALKHELFRLENAFPEFRTADSPTQRVEGIALKSFSKIKHQYRMLSLEDVFSENEFSEWTDRLEKLASGHRFEWFSELKFDGLALSIVYRDGVLHHAATRGDGVIGEDVTNNVRTIESIPLRLEAYRDVQKLAPLIAHGTIEVRGEAIITKTNFHAINRVQKKEGFATYANPRNLAAGSIRQLDPKITASRKLDFFAYDLLGMPAVATHGEKHATLAAIGFKTGGALEQVCVSKEEVFEHHRKIKSLRASLDYDIDGIVVSINDVKLFDRLGTVGKTPRGSIAFKFAPQESITIVEDIVVQVGRTGALTPVAVLRPMAIGGVVVSRATLHNEDEIRRLALKIGDSVIVGRAGDVIPDIRKVLIELRTGREKTFDMPTHCPVCGSKIIKEQSGIIAFCPNKKCPARSRKTLYHFVSRKAFNIDGLGPKILDAFLDNGLIQDAADIFLLKEGDIAPLERFGEKSASNLIQAIEKSKHIELPRFLYALGILHVGEETVQLLSRKIFNTQKNKTISIAHIIARIKLLSQEQLQQIPDIGPKVASSIFDWFHNAHHISFLKKLDAAGIVLATPKAVGGGTTLKGMSFVFTGEMETMSREGAKERVRALGGEVSESISKKTTYVVVGENPGSKYEKAKKLGIAVIEPAQFLKLIKQHATIRA